MLLSIHWRPKLQKELRSTFCCGPDPRGAGMGTRKKQMRPQNVSNWHDRMLGIHTSCSPFAPSSTKCGAAMPRMPGMTVVLIVALHNIYPLLVSRIRDRGLSPMRSPNQHQPRRRNTPGGTSLAAWLPVLAAMAIMITGCLSTFLVLQLDEFRPKVGDIVAFKSGSEDTDMWQIAIPATLVSEIGSSLAKCSLDPNVMSGNGGSLVVEGVEDKPSLQYRVHWASSATARTTGGCGEVGQPIALAHGSATARKCGRRIRGRRQGYRPLADLIGHCLDASTMVLIGLPDVVRGSAHFRGSDCSVS